MDNMAFTTKSSWWLTRKIFRIWAFAIIVLLVMKPESKGQGLYFPPTNGNQWDTLSASDLAWCTQQLPALYQYLDQTNTKAFLVLKDGKMVLERYFGGFTADSVWYWASAGKSLTAFLIGIAQAEGALHLQDSSSKYLGNGWTSATANQEGLIRVEHQLSMTSGLDDGRGNNDCTDDSCLHYLQDAGTRWAYHNAPYTLLDEVVRSATGVSNNLYLQQKVRPITGINGAFIPIGYNQVFFSNPRMMARFGLLMLNRGKWDNTPVLTDTAFFQQMISPSQTHNPAYGYLWWLNGQSSYQLPQSQINFPGPLLPNAPSDLYAAMGKDGQLLMVVPSQQLVVVRLGEATNTGLVPTNFANTLWQYLQAVICTTSGLAPSAAFRSKAFPNPFTDHIHLSDAPPQAMFSLYDARGQLCLRSEVLPLETSALQPGLYFLEMKTADFQSWQKLIKH
jgi:CubicO group peptidase (beta-lactamase class C family)